MSKGCANAIREFFIENNKYEYNIEKLASVLGFENREVRYTVRDFLKRGELTLDDGYLVYHEIKKQKLCLLDKVWRAWRYVPVWTMDEIASLVHTSKDTIKCYVRIYMAEGYIEVAGKKKVGGKRPHTQYRLKDRSIRIRPLVSGQRKLKGVNYKSSSKE